VWRGPAGAALGGDGVVVALPPTNFQVLKRTRKKPEVGQVFAMRLYDGRYLFGRVVFIDPNRLGPVAGYLVYVYKALSDTPDPPWAELTPGNLLIEPFFVSDRGWTRGYFMAVGQRPVGPRDRLKQHCFIKYIGDPLRPVYVDEHGRRLKRPVEPCAISALVNYMVIDDMVSDALGLPHAPLSPKQRKEYERSVAAGRPEMVFRDPTPEEREAHGL
jgi:hypothetical protein